MSINSNNNFFKNISPGSNLLNNSVFGDDWVEISHDDLELKSEFHHYNLITTTSTEEEWLNVDAVQAIKEEEKYLKKYAYGEYLGHHLAYNLDKPEFAMLEENTDHFLDFQKKCLVLEEDGTYTKYNFTELKTDNPGLVGYILTPTAIEPGKTPDIKVIFRGTACSQSLMRDLELSGGAGAISFARNKNAILAQINNAIKDFKAQHHSAPSSQINITLAGHSLGGADAQNCLIGIMEAVSQNHGIEVDLRRIIPAEQRDGMNWIKDVRLFNYNSAGIPKKSEQRSVELAKFLAEQRSHGNTSMNIQTYNLLVAGDGVQQTGEAHVLSDVSSDYAAVDVLKANIGYGHRNVNSLANTVVTNVAGGVAGGIPGCIVMNAAMVAGGAILGGYDTHGAHTAKLFIEKNSKEMVVDAGSEDKLSSQQSASDKKSIKKVSYHRLTNETYAGQENVAKALSKKCHVLNACQQMVGMTMHYGYKCMNSLKGIFGVKEPKPKPVVATSLSTLSPIVPKVEWLSQPSSTLRSKL